MTLPEERRVWKLVLSFRIAVSSWTSYSSLEDVVVSAQLCSGLSCLCVSRSCVLCLAVPRCCPVALEPLGRAGPVSPGMMIAAHGAVLEDLFPRRLSLLRIP